MNSYFRHPSYAGFFYWSLGTQLALQNPVSFVVFFLILWRFFSSRIKGDLIRIRCFFLPQSDSPTVEERALVLFFGEEYKSYRRRVSTRIPFVP
jgi:protein-S-isoprenylcysteine O-methyltransferase